MKKLIRLTTISASLDVLLKGQLNFLNNYFEVIAIASGEKELQKIKKREGVRTINVTILREIKIWRDVLSIIRLLKIFLKERPYIVHANTPKASLLAMAAARLAGVPHRIYTVTGLRFETQTGNFRKLLIIMEKITCYCATKIIPEGEGVKKTLISNRITNKPLHVILNGNINGINTTYYNRTNQVQLLSSKIKIDNLFTFCFIGRIVKDKGINELVFAFIKLYQKHTNSRLILVGGLEKKLNPILPEVEFQILNHPNIFFFGFQEDVRPYLAAANAFVFPSYREGFPNVVLQAGSMELPSIVTNINGCNEIIQDGINGKIIPPQNSDALYNEMKWFYEHRDNEVKEMAKNARPIIIKYYEQHKVWEALLNVYQSLS